MAAKKKSDSKGRTGITPKVTHSQWVEWARETFTCLGFHFDYGIFSAKPSDDMFSSTLKTRLPDWAKWCAVKKVGILPIGKGKQYLEEYKGRRMLTLEEIVKTKYANLSTLQEGLRQAEQRLNDCFETRKDTESKTHTLLSIFVSITVALFSAPQILAIDEPTLHGAIILTGLCFFTSVLCLFRSLKTSMYGVLGRHPHTWLQPGVLEGGDGVHAGILAIVLHDYHIYIGTSDNSNQDKKRWLNRGMILGVSAPAILLVLYIAHLAPYVTHLFG